MTSSTAKPLTGKTALVTGSTSGIGLGIAGALAAAGANLVLNGFGDVSGAVAQIEALVAFAIDRFGAVDVLVNNAGIQHVASIDEFPVEKWDAIIAINLSSAFHTMRVALPKMRDNG